MFLENIAARSFGINAGNAPSGRKIRPQQEAVAQIIRSQELIFAKTKMHSMLREQQNYSKELKWWLKVFPRGFFLRFWSS